MKVQWLAGSVVAVATCAGGVMAFDTSSASAANEPTLIVHVVDAAGPRADADLGVRLPDGSTIKPIALGNGSFMVAGVVGKVTFDAHAASQRRMFDMVIGRSRDLLETTISLDERRELFVATGPTFTNDLCANAVALAVPSTTAGTTVGAGVDAVPDEFCGTSVSAGGVWYSVIGTGTTMTASTCNDANYDTKISIFCKGCDDLACVVGQDDGPGCAGFTTEVPWCSEAGTEYLILMHGFGDATGDFNLTITEDGVPCVPDLVCAPRGACCLQDATCMSVPEVTCVDAGGDYLGDDVPCEIILDTDSFTGGVPTAIPDNDANGITSTIILPGGTTVEDLDVGLFIDHTWVGDLCVSLEHDGVSVALIQRAGEEVPDMPCHIEGPFGCGANNYGIFLDDEGTGGSIEDECDDNLASPPGYTPNELLAAFNGMDRGGAWNLTVSDNASPDAGILLGWTLRFNEVARSCVDCNDNNLLDDIETKPENLPEDAVGQDDCWDAMLIGAGDVYIDNTFGATNDGDPFCGLLFGNFDEWFRYRPTWNGHAFIEINGPPLSWLLSVYDGCGASAKQITCNNINPSGVDFQVERGREYWIRVAARNFGRGSFRMKLLGPDTNLNDLDFNADFIPDECQCLFDVNDDGVVDVDDFFAVLTLFGPCAGPCPADVDGDGVVDEADAQLVWLANGTVCPPD